MSNTTLTYRVEQMEKQVCRMDASIDRLLQNHLPHMQQDIIRMRTEVRVLTAVNLTAIILGLVTAKFL